MSSAIFYLLILKTNSWNNYLESVMLNYILKAIDKTLEKYI